MTDHNKLLRVQHKMKRIVFPKLAERRNMMLSKTSIVFLNTQLHIETKSDFSLKKSISMKKMYLNFRAKIPNFSNRCRLKNKN